MPSDSPEVVQLRQRVLELEQQFLADRDSISDALWRHLAESIPDSVVLFSPEGKLQYANRLRQFPLEQAKTMHYTEFVLPEFRETATRAFDQVLQTGKPAEVEVQDSLEQEWYLSRLGPVWNEGKIVGVVSIARNISQRKDRETRIRHDLDDLERRVTERTNELKAANRSLLKERRVLQRLLDLHDRDRQLVAYEIHDGLVQDMAGALMFFDAAGETIRKANGKAAENYEHGLQLLRTSIQEARRLIDGLRPPVLEEYGLIDAIGNHVEELRDKFQIDVEFKHDVQFVRLSPVVERALYRIVQEALNNLALHSGTSRAFVSLQQRDRYVDIVVRDWGQGFDPAGVKPKRFGLLSIRDRARLLGGEAEIVSAPEQGTTIKVSLPVADVLLPGAAGEEGLDQPTPASTS
jgi:PAS domain S-box-containing protein